jgi:hypothetical protein
MPEPDLARIAAQLALDLHPIGSALTDCATHLSDLSEYIPARGEARVEYDQLVAIITYAGTLWNLADERLTETAFLLQHATDVPNPLPLNA